LLLHACPSELLLAAHAVSLDVRRLCWPPTWIPLPGDRQVRRRPRNDRPFRGRTL